MEPTMCGVFHKLFHLILMTEWGPQYHCPQFIGKDTKAQQVTMNLRPRCAAGPGSRVGLTPKTRALMMSPSSGKVLEPCLGTGLSISLVLCQVQGQQSSNAPGPSVREGPTTSQSLTLHGLFLLFLCSAYRLQGQRPHHASCWPSISGKAGQREERGGGEEGEGYGWTSYPGSKASLGSLPFSRASACSEAVKYDVQPAPGELRSRAVSESTLKPPLPSGPVATTVKNLHLRLFTISYNVWLPMGECKFSLLKLNIVGFQDKNGGGVTIVAQWKQI